MPYISPSGIPMIGIAQVGHLRFEDITTKQGRALITFLHNWGTSLGVERITAGLPDNRKDKLLVTFYGVPRGRLADLVEIMVDEIPHLFVGWSASREDAVR